MVLLRGSEGAVVMAPSGRTIFPISTKHPSSTSQRYALSEFVPIFSCCRPKSEMDDPSKKRRLDEDGTASAFAENTAESRKEKLETWLKPLDNEQLVKLLLDMYVLIHL